MRRQWCGARGMAHDAGLDDDAPRTAGKNSIGRMSGGPAAPEAGATPGTNFPGARHSATSPLHGRQHLRHEGARLPGAGGTDAPWPDPEFLAPVHEKCPAPRERSRRIKEMTP
ncbi:hypothetical protein [Komagataeibacter oboediens]|uniref:hypothetical protein n=1 Tax=Komagataeibacter oboediens TaxID=65958 RepID=UPI0020C4D6F8|nr:hypothetical protein [Komagataeibacter oboediens]